MAACTPINPTNGATVTCSGAANPLAPSYASSADNLTVNVVSGGSAGVLLGLGGTAMSLTGNGTTLNNAGTIDPSLLGLLSLLSSGTVIGNPNLGTAIPGSTVTVSNQGTMKGTTGLLGLNLADLTGMALAVRNGGGGTTSIANSGTIGSSALLGVSLLGSDAPVVAAYGGAQINFTNTGTITGRTAFESSAAGNSFINSGTISGSVSMGTNSTNTFTAVTGSDVNAGGSLGLNLLGVLGINLSFAPTGQIDGGAGGNNTLVLQNVLAGPGSGATGTGSASSATYVNFQHLIVNSGTWSLSGALVSGDATLNGGVAQFDSDANFGSASSITSNGGGVAASASGSTLSKAIALNAGGLTATGGNNFTMSGPLSGTGALTKNGTSTVTLTAADTYTGGTTITAGTLALSANGALASTGPVNLQNAGSAFDLSGANGNRTIGALTGDAGTAIALGARTLIFGDSTNTTFAGAIGGTGGLVKQGSGVFTMSGTNTYTGGTAINAGTLAIGAGGSLAATGAVTLSSAGTSFDISTAGANQTIGALSGVAGSQVALGANTLTLGDASNTTFAGTVGGTGGIVKQGAGTLTLSGADTYTGGTTVNAGTLALGSGGSLAATGTVALSGSGSTLDLSAAGAQSIGALAGVAGSSVILGANALTLAPTGSGSFGGTISGTGSVVINGSGTETLTGANIYTGGTGIQSGTLALGVGGALAGGSALTLASGGTFDISAGGNQTIGALAGAGGTVNLGANSLSVGGSGGGSFDGVIQGTGGVTNIANALVLNGANTYTGLTTVQAGSLTVGDATHAGASVAGDITVASSASLGGFGTVGGSVTVQSGGHLAPGNPTGTLTVNTDLTLAQGSVLDFSFGAPGPNFTTFGSGHNVVVNGNLAINGATLNPIDAGGFGPGLYNLFTYGGTLTETNGGITPPSGFTIQNLTASKQINLINTNGLMLNFWNANGLASSTAMGGGSGTWSVPGANWTDSVGSITSTRQPADAFAIFGGASGTVTVDNTGGAVTALGMQFASDGYLLTGGALGLAVPSPGALSEIRVGDGSAASAGWTATIDNTLTGLGFNKTGAGTLVLGGSNTYTQGTTLSAGTLSVSADANLGAASAGLDFEGGILQVTGTAFQSTAHTITLGAAGGGFDIANAANVFTVSEALSGTGSLTKLGAGTLVLAGANSYSGGTTISAGTLQGDATSLQGNIADNASLIFDQGADGTFAGIVSGSGSLTKLGAGTLTLSGANTYSGGTTISAGALQGDTTSLQGNITDNASLIFNQGTDGTFAGIVSGSGSLTKLGAGTLALSGTNSYSG
ncbi:MAG TPA: autotransporter-associated beta strand repeat-containing protein, partial [Rhodanobacter sp.]|nr:autotransporter-associated beta strand repeat-containing protein [Rhodanobacter sp.]